MRVRQAVGVALVSAAAVVGTDLLMDSALLHVLRPQITIPADGAIISGPVTVSWQGPQPMQAMLTGNGQRIDLGLRESPFEIDPSRFPRPGQYGLELASPRFGRLISVDRRFMVRRGPNPRVATAAGVEAPPPAERAAPPAADLAALLAERDRLRVDLAALQAQVDSLRAQLSGSDEDLDNARADADARVAGAQAEQDALAREHLLTLEENQLLRQRLQSVPPCTVWGYMAVPRPQTVPPSRFVLVSNRRGDVFRSEGQCLATRRGDPTSVSPCICVGAVF
jgi:hypothetical protein